MSEHRTSENASPAAVVFDLDGLMVNTEEIYPSVMRVLLERRGIAEFDEDLRNKMMGQPGPAAFRTMFHHHDLPEEPYESIQAESDAVFHDLLPTRLNVMPGLLALLDALDAAAIPKAIATSSRRKFLDYVLDRFSLGERFRFFLTAENVVHGKPNPEIYLKAADRHGLPPGQVVALEDSPNGCRAAVAAGLFTIAVPGPHTRGWEFPGARFVAETLADRRIFETLGLR